MLLLSGALVSGPYALITTAVSADLVSNALLTPTQGQHCLMGKASFTVVPG